MKAPIAWPLALSLALSVAPHTAGAQWQLLGSRRVSYAVDRDVIQVGAVEGQFNAVRIDVNQGDLEMFNIRLVFGDGDTWSPDTRITFQQGSRSRVIDLPGAARVVRRVEFLYRSRARRGYAGVQLYGRRADGPVASPPPAPGPASVPDSWESLGTRTVDFRVDRDVIGARGQGKFRQVRLVVEGGDIEMFDVVITFANGEKWSPATRLRFDQHTRSRVIDLPGAARTIKRIDFYYQSIAGGRQGRAVVQAHGR